MDDLERQDQEESTQHPEQDPGRAETPAPEAPNQMSEAQRVAKAKREFKVELSNFFSEHNPKKLKFVTKIVERFSGREEIVMAHLRAKYSHGQVPKRKRASSPEGAAVAEAAKAPGKKEQVQGKGKKSSKKILVIGIAAVVLIALCAVGYLFKDKILGKHEKAAEQPKKEQVKEAVVTETKEEAAKPEEEKAAVAADSTAASDSSDHATTAPDSAAADSSSK